MNTKEKIKKEITSEYDKGLKLAHDIHGKEDGANFHFAYQAWYTKALRVVEILAPDRYQEFRSYYEIDPKRKALGWGTFVIQDYMKGIAPSSNRCPGFDSNKQVVNCFINQLSIYESLLERIDSTLGDIESEIFIELKDTELQTAKSLIKTSCRAAGALAGVVIENYLQKLAKNHKIKLKKRNPTISDLNDPLKNAGVIDTPTWRKVSYLADVRNLCSHKKESEPTKEQVLELIDGANWLIKSVF